MQELRYVVDIVMCIGGTRGMKPLLDLMKSKAIRLESDMTQVIAEKGQRIDSLRVRIVAFRDSYVDTGMVLEASPFFELPKEGPEFESFLRRQNAPGGGGNGGKAGLAALALAILSEWDRSGDRRRQIIVLWTDDATYRADEVSKEMPSGNLQHQRSNLDSLTELWEVQGPMTPSAKRLILHAPEAYPWVQLTNDWSQCIHYGLEAGEGVTNLDYSSIIDRITSSF